MRVRLEAFEFGPICHFSPSPLTPHQSDVFIDELAHGFLEPEVGLVVVRRVGASEGLVHIRDASGCGTLPFVSILNDSF